MIVRGSTLAASCLAHLRLQRRLGYWDGPGIISSTAATDPNGLTSVGVIDNAEFGYTDFAGIFGLVGTEILVKYTWYGDADLNGVVTATT